MTNQFSTGGDGQKQLQKFYKKAPRAFQRTSAAVLNSMAFSDRKGSMRELGRSMIIRNPGLVKKAARVKMAKENQSINQQESISGSIKTKRHDAFEHVEEGTATRATRFTKEGRKGSQANVGQSTARIGKAQTYENDYRLKGSGDTRIINYLQQIQADKTRRRKTFMISRRFKNMDPGIYKFKGGRVGKMRGKRTLVGAKLRLLSTPGSEAGSRFKPKAIHWKSNATRKNVTERAVQNWWVDNQQRQLRKALGK